MKFGLVTFSLLCLAVMPASAGALKAPAATQDNIKSDGDTGGWMDSIAGKQLLAADGSSVTLTPTEGGFVLDAVTPDGAAHDTTFNLLGDNLGSISEGGEKVTGVFRIAGNTIAANFSDGRAETLAVNSAGGVTILLDAPDAKSWCMKWYPQNHAFDDADKRAALAEYAHRLGIAAPKEPIATHTSCIEQDAHPAMAAEPPAPPPAAPMKTAALGTTGKVHGLAEPISVRTSQVHLIDPPVAPSPAQVVAPPVLSAPQQVKTADLGADHPLIQSHGASSCLKIDTDGSSWGFHNSCGYGVQYAWCLQNGSERATACGTGTGSGSLDGNGFVALMPGNAVVDADNQFRWVACHGGKDVSAQLDRSDPPAGRCMISSDQ